jgi:tripartite-type tricarboxylate transporter receptor subunit TctC
VKLVTAKLMIATAGLALFAGLAHAQTAVRMLSGHPPGGAVDILARTFAERLSEALGRPVVVETRSGAGGQIAAAALKTSPADGSTLMTIPASALTLYPHTTKAPINDTLNDFVPVAHVGSYETGLAVGANVPAKNLKEWVEFVKADKKNAVYSAGNVGTDLHFLGVALSQAAGLNLVHVPYRGVGPTTIALIAGEIPSVTLPFAQMLPQVRAGRIRILAHSGGKRAAVAPEIPTFKELGYPGLEISSWYVIIAPAKMPADLVARYNDIFVQAQRTQAVRDRMRSLDLDIHELTPAQLVATLKSDHDRWGPIVRASGFSADSQ